MRDEPVEASQFMEIKQFLWRRSNSGGSKAGSQGWQGYSNAAFEALDPHNWTLMNFSTGFTASRGCLEITEKSVIFINWEIEAGPG